MDSVGRSFVPGPEWAEFNAQLARDVAELAAKQDALRGEGRAALLAELTGDAVAAHLAIVDVNVMTLDRAREVLDTVRQVVIDRDRRTARDPEGLAVLDARMLAALQVPR